MRTLTFATATALLLMSSAYAEQLLVLSAAQMDAVTAGDGWSTAQLSNSRGDRGDVGPSGTGRDPYLGQTVNIIKTGNASGISTAPGSSYSTAACCT